MQPFEGQGYTREQVIAALHSPYRVLRYRYDLLDRNNQFKMSIDGVVIGGAVTHQTFADIKRTARFTLVEPAIDLIDFLNDRVQPYVGVRMPDGGWRDWPQGVFLLSTPVVGYDRGVRTREVEAYDQTLVLREDLISDRYTVPFGAAILDEVDALLPMAMQSDPNTATMAAARSWDPGTSKYVIVADLLSMLGYRSLSFDGAGVAQVRQYVSPDDTLSEYIYTTEDRSVVTPQAMHELDLFSVPNTWTLVVSQPDQEELVATVVNDSIDSPTSTINRGRVITDFRTDVEAPDERSLLARAKQIAVEASQVFDYVKFSTLSMPVHGDADVYSVVYEPLDVVAKFSETSWGLPLAAGSQMSHEARRVVKIA